MMKNSEREKDADTILVLQPVVKERSSIDFLLDDLCPKCSDVDRAILTASIGG